MAASYDYETNETDSAVPQRSAWSGNADFAVDRVPIEWTMDHREALMMNMIETTKYRVRSPGT